jgi:tetratricopeptide (TPR) repeat protein
MAGLALPLLAKRACGRVAIAGLAVLFSALAPANAADQATWDHCNGKNLDAVIEACATILRDDKESAPKRAVALSNRGFAYRRKGDLDRAIADLNEAIRLDPRLANAFSNRGYAYNGKKEYERAISDLNEAIRLDPKHSYAFTNRAWAYRQKGDLDRAVTDADEAVRLDPKNFDAYNVRGLVHERKRDYDRAIADFSEAIQLAPKFVLAFVNRGLAYRRKGDIDRAIADASEAIRLDAKSAAAFNARGFAYNGKKDYDLAIADLNEAIRLDPKHIYAFTNRGFSYRRKNDFDRAINDLNEAIRLDPTNAEVVENRGWFYAERKDYDRAIADYSEALRLDPRQEGPYFGRGLAYERKGDLPRAIVDFEVSLSFFPNQPRVRAALDRVREALVAKPASGKQTVLASSREEPLASGSILEKRVALVIGNGAYESLPRLRNPSNDAADMAASLRALGFDVSVGLDLKRSDMEDRVISFAKAARAADAALVFYAGHGLQHQGINYLAPTDARITDEADLLKLIKVQALIQNLQGAKNAGILVLDACRDNDAVTKLAASLPKSRAAGFRGGLAAEKAEGIIIAFATQPGRVAIDGIGRNSPFTSALLKHLPSPGLDARLTFARVRTDVLRATGGEQRPEVSDSLDGEFIFKR